jgi:hypothetical protein
VLSSPGADLLLDATMNMPKSFSLAVLLRPELRSDLEALQDAVRDRTLSLWRSELNARRGAGGRLRETISRIEVVELRHERSRALDPHVHRHLWLSVKVLGCDGVWSNVDSRVAMRLHTLVNAEGDLASRTDPAWVAALARCGYTLDADGEIAELAHLVRPLSRRSNQIEANRLLRLAEWRRDHPGRQPGPEVLALIDRWAWSTARPNKPPIVDEEEWAMAVRDEISVLDPSASTPSTPVEVRGARVADLDPNLLAELAVADADRRSFGSGGRFSRIDIRAGATRALAASGVVVPRAAVDELLEDVTARALTSSAVDLVLEGESPAAHVKHLMATSTAAAKAVLADRVDAIPSTGHLAPDPDVEVAERATLGDAPLAEDQREAVAAVAGTQRLVTVTGPAGTGKTTMLRVARRVLDRDGRRMVVVAPTRKAAAVAGREVGADASSLHALLMDHGYRHVEDRAGRPVWTRLRPGQRDPATGIVFAGPTRFRIGSKDRVVVDEAGMVDLHSAVVLIELAHETGAGIVMVGDPRQALPVGHSGAMETVRRRAGAAVELSSVHRFTDPAYAALSLRLRDARDAAEATAIARTLHGRGQVQVVSSATDAREAMVTAWFQHATRGQEAALVTATNAEAQQINDRIQQERLDRGHLQVGAIAIGRSGQRLLVGDIVQTRRNDNRLGVTNRATWSIVAVRSDGIELAERGNPSLRRVVSHDYAADHVHLAYASTVHGIQGETMHTAYVGPDVDASGLYVGMTRGRHDNVAIVPAGSTDRAIEQLADTMLRGVAELTMDDARRAARRDLDRAAADPQADARVHEAERTVIALRRLDAQVAADEATSHARAANSPDRRARERSALVSTLQSLRGVRRSPISVAAAAAPPAASVSNGPGI